MEFNEEVNPRNNNGEICLKGNVTDQTTGNVIAFYVWWDIDKKTYWLGDIWYDQNYHTNRYWDEERTISITGEEFLSHFFINVPTYQP